MARYRGKDGKTYNFKPHPDAKPIPDNDKTPEIKPATETTSVKFADASNLVTEGTNTTGGKKAALRLFYPLEDQDLYPASIKFSVMSIDPYEVDAQAAAKIFDIKLIEDGEAAVKIAETATKDAKAKAVTNEGYDAFKYGDDDEAEMAAEADKLAARERANSKPVDNDLAMKPRDQNKHVKLYFPIVQMQDAVSYDLNSALGTAGATALSGVNNQNSMLGSLAKGLSEGLTDMFNLVRGDLDQQAAQIAATRVFNKMPSGGVQNATRIALQKVMTPNTRSMMTGVPIRTHSFQFKLIATSSREAIEVERIIKLFRTELYPETIGVAGIPLAYKFPNLFKLQFMYNDAPNKNIPQPLLCYLNTVNTVYNGGTSSVFHYDGQPTEVDLTLTFSEFRALTRQDIETGSSASGGPH